MEDAVRDYALTPPGVIKGKRQTEVTPDASRRLIIEIGSPALVIHSGEIYIARDRPSGGIRIIASPIPVEKAEPINVLRSMFGPIEIGVDQNGSSHIPVTYRGSDLVRAGSPHTGDVDVVAIWCGSGRRCI